MLRVGFYQFRPLFGQVDRNLQKILETLKQVEADLVVLPELAFTGYHFKNRAEVGALAEDPERSATLDSLQELCKERNIHLVAGFAEKRHEKLFNSACLIGPAGLLHIYRKLHLFSGEKNLFEPGDTPLSVQEVRGTKIGIMVCFDWVFPEVARCLSLLGAQVLCHPSNLVLNYCQQSMLTRCLENSVFAITANRFGADKRPHGELRFTGQSQIVAPRGRLLHRARAQRETLFITEIEPDLANDKHITPVNDMFVDRRPEYYDAIG